MVTSARDLRRAEAVEDNPIYETLVLVGGFNPSEKILVKMGIFPNFRGENKKYLKPPSRVG